MKPGLVNILSLVEMLMFADDENVVLGHFSEDDIDSNFMFELVI